MYLVYVCSFIKESMYVCMCTYVNMYLHVWMSVCMFVCMYVSICLPIIGNKESIAKADIELVLDDSNPGMYADFVSNSSAYLDARGLRANSFSLNGIVIEDHSISTNVMQLLGRQAPIHT